jgi:hypothetical protein
LLPDGGYCHSSGGWIRNDQNSDGDAQQIISGHSACHALCDTTP